MAAKTGRAKAEKAVIVAAKEVEVALVESKGLLDFLVYNPTVYEARLKLVVALDNLAKAAEKGA